MAITKMIRIVITMQKLIVDVAAEAVGTEGTGGNK